MVQSVFNRIGNCSSLGGLPTVGWAAELWSDGGRPLHVEPRVQGRSAALPGIRTRTGQFTAVLNPALAAPFDPRLIASLSGRLNAQVRPEFDVRFKARLIAGLSVDVSSSMTASLNSPVRARLTATLSQALAEELTGGLSP